ncbi:MAG: GNAT family N-acetyltransferase [Planctomycetaceae bacterium]|nr:GNAT family N-acetyltransferase [Planctomycetaceae bacterium]
MRNAFEIVNEFERQVADYAGSRFAVAVDTCSSALFLASRYLSVGTVRLPERTYCSVPAAVLHAGGRVKFSDLKWQGEYGLDPYPIVDSAGRFRRGMYGPGEFRCVSFHWTKILPVGRGGMILHDNPDADEWFRLARFSGRHACDQFNDPGYALAGWNVYLDPCYAARGLTLLKNLPDSPADIRTHESYPSMAGNPVYGEFSDHYRLPPSHDVNWKWRHEGLTFRQVTAEDAADVVRWRNYPSSRAAFFTDRELTEDDHRRFMQQKSYLDLVWIVHCPAVSDRPIGMVSLSLETQVPEYGRLVLDEQFHGQGFGERIERAVLYHNFRTLRFPKVWAEYLESNTVIARLHEKTGWKIVSHRDSPRGRVVHIQHRGEGVPA